MKSDAFTVRAPAAWSGRVTSFQVRRMLAEYFQHPSVLPEDPGAGDAYLRLSLPGRAVRAFAAQVGDEPSAALRRLIRAHVGLPAAKSIPRLQAVPVTVKAAPRVEIISRPALPAPAASPDDCLDMACDRCNAITRHRLVRGRWECLPCCERDRLLAKLQEQATYEARRCGLQAQWWGGQSSETPVVHVPCGYRDRLASWWNRYGLLVIVGLILLVVGIVKLRGWMTAKPAAAAFKPVAVPVEKGFMVWLPKQ